MKYFIPFSSKLVLFIHSYELLFGHIIYYRNCSGKYYLGQHDTISYDMWSFKEIEVTFIFLRLQMGNDAFIWKYMLIVV